MEFESILLPGIDAKRPLVIAGPCSAETEEQVMTTAKELAAAGVKIFRAGVWKPRTKPGGFEGVGSPALKWLMQAEKETGMYMAMRWKSGWLIKMVNCWRSNLINFLRVNKR